eukprot:TRINITY_DN21471_c0_g1_i6.p2 TRINITY_DN21471_c0_g1~~TRINITY_DN21471_c0_g1_i6.p2  ORF type:complete len:126 (-),score=2.14 TRINITY_DN21471_c0_g1_i6:39-416(-)
MHLAAFCSARCSSSALQQLSFATSAGAALGDSGTLGHTLPYPPCPMTAAVTSDPATQIPQGGVGCHRRSPADRGDDARTARPAATPASRAATPSSVTPVNLSTPASEAAWPQTTCRLVGIWHKRE